MRTVFGNSDFDDNPMPKDQPRKSIKEMASSVYRRVSSVFATKKSLAPSSRLTSSQESDPSPNVKKQAAGKVKVAFNLENPEEALIPGECDRQIEKTKETGAADSSDAPKGNYNFFERKFYAFFGNLILYMLKKIE